MALMGTVDARCVAGVLAWKEVNGEVTYPKLRLWAAWRSSDAQKVLALAKFYKRERDEANGNLRLA
jgi:hypothetical protein